MGTIRSYDKQMRHLAHLLIGGERKMGRKNCAVIMLTSACLVLTACAPTEFPEQNGTEHQNQMEGVAKQELTEFDTDDVEKIPDHLPVRWMIC